MGQEVRRVPASPNDVCPLMPGASVPSVTLRMMDGSEVELAAAVREKPSILVFYRGGW
jgi:peroxiredoxin